MADTEQNPNSLKTYLGDSVYVQRGPFAGEAVLTTENGLPGDPSNTVVLGPGELAALVAWARMVEDRYRRTQGDDAAGTLRAGTD